MSGPSLPGTASQRVIALLLVVALALFFFAVTAVQVTSSGQGQRILRRAVAVATDIDTSLPTIESDLHTAAARDGAGSQVRVPDFPIPVDIPRSEATAIGGGDLRSRILDQAGQKLYDNGMSAWAATDPAAQQSIRRLSSAGALRQGLGLIRSDVHTFLIISAIVFGVIVLALATALVAGPSQHMRLIVLGGAAVGAAVPSLVAVTVVDLWFHVAKSGADPFTRRMLDLGIDGLGVALRNYLALMALGAATVIVGASLRRWEARATAAAARTRPEMMH